MSLRHHSLIAWQRADDLFIKLHQLSLKQLPAFEKFELGGQLRRAAFSVARRPYALCGPKARPTRPKAGPACPTAPKTRPYSVQTRTCEPRRSA
jgi:hypothetical protein